MSEVYVQPEDLFSEDEKREKKILYNIISALQSKKRKEAGRSYGKWAGSGIKWHGKWDVWTFLSSSFIDVMLLLTTEKTLIWT